MSLLIKCLIFAGIISMSCGARILCIFYCSSYSHQIVFHPIYRELSKRGHELVVVTPVPLKDPHLSNLTEIDINYFFKKYNNILVEGFKNNLDYFSKMNFALNLTNTFTDDLWQNKDFKKLYQNAANEHFDLVMVEAISPIYPAFGHVFNAPTIGIYSLEASLDAYSSLGGITHPSIYGGMFADFDYPLSIWEKIQNLFIFAWHKFYIRFVHAPAIDQQTRHYLGNDFPSILDLEKNISLLFVTKNIVMNTVRPVPSNIVELDFLHIQKPKPLPEDLADILNNSTQGVVYFSLGSNVKSSTMPKHIINAITEGLSSLPYTVLWKWETDNVPGVSSNVITRKWFSQQDILAHPNIKVFVTQGGLQSSEEAIARSVPLVGIPVIADQEDNIKKLSNLGVAIGLSLSSLTADSLKNAIIEVAENNKYSKRMKQLRDVAFDQPMTGLERAIWWSEYVIRNKGAPALRSALADMPLYEYLLLDVLAVLLGILITLWFSFKLAFKINISAKKKID